MLSFPITFLNEVHLHVSFFYPVKKLHSENAEIVFYSFSWKLVPQKLTPQKFNPSIIGLYCMYVYHLLMIRIYALCPG